MRAAQKRRARARTPSQAWDFRIGDVDTGRYYAVLANDPCAYCGATAQHTDHIVPYRKGGENNWTNYTSACAACNGAKGDRSLLGHLLYAAMRPERDELEQQMARTNDLGPTPIRTGKAKANRVTRYRKGGAYPERLPAHAATGAVRGLYGF
jgi:hypothetical protein